MQKYLLSFFRKGKAGGREWLQKAAVQKARIGLAKRPQTIQRRVLVEIKKHKLK